MTRDEFLRRFEEMLEADPGSVTPDSTLQELGWDSLEVVTFLALADEQLGVQLRPRDINASKTVSDLVALFGERISG